MREEKEILMRMFVNGALSPDELRKLMTALEASETETLSEQEGQYPTHQKGTLQEAYTSTVMDDLVSSEVGRFMRGELKQLSRLGQDERVEYLNQLQEMLQSEGEELAARKPKVISLCGSKVGEANRKTKSSVNEVNISCAEGFMKLRPLRQLEGVAILKGLEQLKTVEEFADCQRLQRFDWRAPLEGLTVLKDLEAYEENEEREIPLQAKAQVILCNNFRGDIVVRPAEDGRLKISATKRLWARTKQEAQKELNNVKIYPLQDAHRTYVLVHRISDFVGSGKAILGGHGAQIDFQLFVPAEIKLELTSIDGNISAKGIANDIDVSVYGGDANLQSIRGKVAVKSVTGLIHLEDICGEIIAETTVGQMTVANCHADSIFNTFASDICLNNVSGQIKASSVLGNIEAENIVSSALSLETTSGGISAECLPLIGGEHRIRTISGDIQLTISDLADCSLWAKVEDGKLQVELPMEVMKKSDNHLFANLRKGRATMTVESETGSVKIGRCQGA